MKRLVCLLLVIFIMSASFVAVADENTIEVLVDGEFISFPDQPPVMVNDRVLVPLRAIFEALGARVYYDDETSLITAKRNLTTIELTVGSDKLYINGEETVIDVPAFVQNGRTLVPVRAVSEALGVTVDWDEETPCVVISSLFWEHYTKIESIVENYSVDGKNVTIECYYPQLRSGKEKILKFNKLLKKDAETYISDVKTNVTDYSETELNFTRDYLITYDYADCFSYIVQDTVNNKNIYQTSFNYDIPSCKSLKITEFEISDVNGNPRDYKTIFKYYISNSPEMFYDNATEIIDSIELIKDYYLTFKGFAYFINPGVISPEENGIITIEVEN
ncbi:MAG: copper amine oxidase N-terminal domain-containing protein [Clostridia bacterium]|nr:copper amine oxidase N-terminal domain-containing protein [Clostridia bacterium]